MMDLGAHSHRFHIKWPAANFCWKFILEWISYGFLMNYVCTPYTVLKKFNLYEVHTLHEYKISYSIHMNYVRLTWSGYEIHMNLIWTRHLTHWNSTCLSLRGQWTFWELEIWELSDALSILVDYVVFLRSSYLLLLLFPFICSGRLSDWPGTAGASSVCKESGRTSGDPSQYKDSLSQVWDSHVKDCRETILSLTWGSLHW